MARGVNEVRLIGGLGRDPEPRYMPNGKMVVNLSVATDEGYTDKNTGKRVEKTEWHNVVVFDKAAEYVSEYLRKGSQVWVAGKLQTRKWKDKEGNNRSTTEVIAIDLQGLDRRPTGSSVSAEASSPNDSGLNNKKPAVSYDDFDDDIPF